MIGIQNLFIKMLMLFATIQSTKLLANSKQFSLTNLFSEINHSSILIVFSNDFQSRSLIRTRHNGLPLSPLFIKFNMRKKPHSLSGIERRVPFRYREVFSSELLLCSVYGLWRLASYIKMLQKLPITSDV